VLAISKAKKTEPSSSQTPTIDATAQHIEAASQSEQRNLRTQVSVKLSPFVLLRRFFRLLSASYTIAQSLRPSMQIVWYYSWTKDLDNKFRMLLNSRWKLRTLFHSRSTTSMVGLLVARKSCVMLFPFLTCELIRGCRETLLALGICFSLGRKLTLRNSLDQISTPPQMPST